MSDLFSDPEPAPCNCAEYNDSNKAIDHYLQQKTAEQLYYIHFRNLESYGDTESIHYAAICKTCGGLMVIERSFATSSQQGKHALKEAFKELKKLSKLPRLPDYTVEELRRIVKDSLLKSGYSVKKYEGFIDQALD